MYLPSLVAAPSETPITLDELKSWTDIDYAEDDALLTIMLNGAVVHLDGPGGVLGRAMVAQTWELKFDTFEDLMSLGMIGVTNIDSVTYFDDANTPQVLAPENYELIETPTSSVVALAYDQSWPSTYDRRGAVAVQFDAGYGAATAVPRPLKVATAMVASDLYEHREAQSQNPYSHNAMVSAMISPYRRWIS